LKLRLLIIVLVLFVAAGFITAAAETACAAGENITLDYFIQHPNYTLTFWYSDNGSTAEFTTKWNQVAWNKYKKTCYYQDGFQNFFYYLFKNDKLLETKTGWAVPDSEWTDYPVIQGSNVVFKNASPGTSWSNEYLTRDAWGSINREFNSFTYEGIENIEIQGHPLEAAKLSWTRTTIAQQVSPQAEWESISQSSKGEDWYIRGLGLVKRNFLNKEGNITSGFTLKSIWDSSRNRTVPIDEWLPVSIIINGEEQGKGISAGLYNDSLLVLVRATFQHLGRSFTWDQKTKILTIETLNGSITMVEGNNHSKNTSDGSIQVFPAPAKIINGKLMVPVEFIQEVLGVNYRWDKAGRVVELF
jgi:hypothetical protein